MSTWTTPWGNPGFTLFATAIGRRAEAERYAKSAAEIAAAFNRKFFDAEKGNYATGSQTANAMPLVLGLVPAGHQSAVAERLVEDVRGRGNAISAGDVGFRYLLRALAQSERSDVVLDMNNQSLKPGYGYQLAHGATSLTEAWNADRRSSQNHFMLGQITEWFYQDLAGLAPDPASPGFGCVIVRPNPVGSLIWAHARYLSPRGVIDVKWRRREGRLHVDVTVPANARARIEMPVSPSAVILESGVPAATAPGVRSVSPVGGRPTFEVGSGQYGFESPL